MIRSTGHSIKETNTGKQEATKRFVAEYRLAAGLILDYVWANGYVWHDKEGLRKEFDPANNLLEFPSMLSSDIIAKAGVSGVLTGRALKCCLTQVAGCIGAAVEKQRKRLYIMSQRKKEGDSRKSLKILCKKIKANIPQKPRVSNINPELNSICMDIQESQGEFQHFLRLKSIFKDKTEIILPLRMHRRAKAFMAHEGSRLLNSVSINKTSVTLRWEIPKVPLKEVGMVVGADQGMKDILNIACDGYHWVTPKADVHGHTCEKIMEKMARKRKGSKAMRKAQRHQTNFVNWSLNQLPMGDLKTMNYEEIWNIGYKNPTTAKMGHWNSTKTRDKVEDLGERHGVHVVFQGSTYASQRCSSCGMVRKANRKRKVYECRHCGSIMDADHNAALNHSIDLPEVPWTLRVRNLNRGKGFFWNLDGFFDCEGRSLQSLPPDNKPLVLNCT